MAQLVQVRTNTRFILNYEKSKLEPEIELIFLVANPVYTPDMESENVVKSLGFTEVRVNASPESLTNLIGQLQALQHPVAGFENMAAAFNTIIEHSKK